MKELNNPEADSYHLSSLGHSCYEEKNKLVSIRMRTVVSVGTQLPNVTLSIIKFAKRLTLRNTRNCTISMRKVCVCIYGNSKSSKKYVGFIIKLLLDYQLQVLNCK